MSGLDPELVELMHDEVTIEPATGRNRYAEMVYGPPVKVKCYLSRMSELTLTRQGREETSTVQIILSRPDFELSGPGLDPEDARLTLPWGDQPSIMRVLKAPDEDGDPYYMEIRA